MTQPQDPSGQPFPAYDPTVSHSADWVVVFAMSNGQNQNTSFTDKMTEIDALRLVESVAQRQPSAYVDIDDQTVVVQVSDREILIYRSGIFTGDKLTRVSVARVR